MVDPEFEVFVEALKYPFARFGRLFYWLWLLVPVFGWFAYGGYLLNLLELLIKKKALKEVPAFGSFWKNFWDGVSFLPVALVYLVITFVFYTRNRYCFCFLTEFFLPYFNV